MGAERTAWRTWTALAVLLAWLALPPALPLAAAVIGREENYVCDDEPLVAVVDNGAVDAAGIPNSSGGTVPGAFVLLRWQGLTLQLPRTNNAGAPSFTDGSWWWSLEDPDHPRFRLRRGDVRDFSCRRAP